MTKEAAKTDKKPSTVYEAIAAVMRDIAVEGISKDRTNTQGSGYKFRGIDDVYNALSPILAKHGLVILPRVLSRDITERTSQKGGNLFYVVLQVEFDFVCSADGSKHTVITFGEAMDSGDKATNKAMSAAYKYACMQAFCIPTEGDNDADGQTHEVKPKAAQAKNPNFSMALDREQADAIYDQALKKLNGAADLNTLKTVWSEYEKTLKALPQDLQADLIQKKDECKAALTNSLNGATAH